MIRLPIRGSSPRKQDVTLRPGDKIQAHAAQRGLQAQLNRDLVHVLEMPAIKQKFFAAGMEVVGRTPEALAAVVKNDMTRLGAVLSAARPAAEKR